MDLVVGVGVGDDNGCRLVLTKVVRYDLFCPMSTFYSDYIQNYFPC
jgi:hypothetical protein